MWALMVATTFAAIAVVAPTTLADDTAECVGASWMTRDKDEPTYWESTYEGATVHNVFTPVTEENDDEWSGVHKYFGVCGIVQSITDCLADSQPVTDCLPD